MIDADSHKSILRRRNHDFKLLKHHRSLNHETSWRKMASSRLENLKQIWNSYSRQAEAHNS